MPYFIAKRRLMSWNGGRSCIIEMSACQPPGATTSDTPGWRLINPAVFGSTRLMTSTWPDTMAFMRAAVSLMTVTSNASTLPRPAFQ